MDSDLLRRANEVIDAATARRINSVWTEQERLIRDLASALGEAEARLEHYAERYRNRMDMIEGLSAKLENAEYTLGIVREVAAEQANKLAQYEALARMIDAIRKD